MDREELRRIFADGVFAAWGDIDRDGLYAVDLDGRFIDANAVFYERTGLTPDVLTTMHIGAAVLPEYRQLVAESFAAVKTGEVRAWRAVARLRDDEVASTFTINVPYFRNGDCVAVIGIVRDIGALEQTEQKARELETRLADTLDSLEDGIFFVNRDWVFTYANQRAEQMSGRTTEQLLGRSLWELFPHLVDTGIGETYRAAMQTGSRTEFRGFSPGLSRWVAITANPVSDGLAVYARDIGDEVEAQTLLHKSEKRTLTQAALLDAARDAMIVRNLDGTVAYWNRAATELYGWTPDEAIGSDPRELLYDEPNQFDEALSAVFRSDHWSGTLHQRTEDGRRIIVESRWTLVRSAEGDPDSVFEVTTDITQQLAAEQRQLRAQRLESLGRLAGGIAHDLNNVLTPILLSSQLLADEQADPASRDLAIGIERAAVRGADLIKQVLAFARGDDGNRQRVRIANLIADLERFCREMLPKDIAVAVHYEQGVPDVHGDATQLMQVLVNIVVNARDAMPNGGSLTIDTRRGTGSAESVVIEVTDSGTGIEQSVLETIFEPFFTTKEFGSGTGLGLATSLSIAQRHGGSLTATSRVGVGSILRVELPAMAAADSTSAVADDEAHRPQRGAVGAGELVLVVDDEADIRAINCQMLEAAGYRTLSAADGQAGLAIHAVHGASVELVVTDIMMPLLDGAGFVRELQSRGYGGPVLATSGGIQAGDPISDLPRVAFLAKPYSAHQLVTAAHELLADR